jgi:hypothetical protein
MWRTKLSALCAAGVIAACGSSGTNTGDRDAAVARDGNDGTPDATLADAAGEQDADNTPADATSDSSPIGEPSDTGSDGHAASDSSPVGEPADAGNEGAATEAGLMDATPDGSMGGACAGSDGAYTGTLAGSYASSLVLGIPLSITGNVTFALAPAGSAGTTCTVDGATHDCAALLTLQQGTIVGAMSKLGADAGGGYQYFCSVTGDLDCASNALLDGWMQCTYCVGPLSDAGACGGAVGGHFAGLMTASYDPATHAFVMGTWNASELLAGNDGHSPGPDGGSPLSYLSDAGYGFLKAFGGDGTWTAALSTGH